MPGSAPVPNMRLLASRGTIIISNTEGVDESDTLYKHKDPRFIHKLAPIVLAVEPKVWFVRVDENEYSNPSQLAN